MSVLPLLVPIILLTLRLIRYLSANSSSSSYTPDHLSTPLPPLKRALDMTDFLKIATKELQNNKSADEVKEILRTKGMREDKIGPLVDRAVFLHERWFIDNPEDEDIPALKTVTTKVPLENAYSPVDETEEVPDIIDPLITVSNRDARGHGNHFGALMGFERSMSATGKSFIQQMMAVAAIQPSLLTNGCYAIADGSFSTGSNNNLLPKIRTVKVYDQIKTAYPHLKTDQVIPFRTKEITEWNYDKNIEADIKGSGHDIYGIGFFATDYAVNRQIYKTTPELNIRISAFAFIVDAWENPTSVEVPFNDDFVGFIPNGQFGGFSYFDFTGKILKVTSAAITPQIPGCIITLQLINIDETPKILIVDTFVNNDNIKAPQISKGMIVSGLLWLQGEIAGN